MRLVWREPYKGEDRVRVFAWTCECEDTVYELCHAAGLAHIRRRRLVNGATELRETYRWRLGEAHSVWGAILGGQAR
ncbi:hypothetical protein GCM10020216_074800 [Nonomuraea helvata]